MHVSHDGVQPYQKRVLDIIASAQLSERKMIKVGRVGVHPDNKEKNGPGGVRCARLAKGVCGAGVPP